MPALFQIKICGITSAADANMVAASGADAIGLNFYPKSSRFISQINARKISQELPQQIKRVGVFVNAPIKEVLATAEQLPLDYVQLHGEEDIAYIQQLSELKVIRALRFNSSRAAELKKEIRELKTNAPNVKAILLDAYDSQHYGGTGKQIEWNLLSELTSLVDSFPLILAGGLNPTTVAAAIHAVRPAAVDVASGVESKPGSKDAILVTDFVKQSLLAMKNPLS